MYIAARLSLGFLWVFTGVTSAFFAKDVAYQVLAQGGIAGIFADYCIFFGSSLDVVIGIWLLIGWRFKLCCLVQILTVVAYSLLLTIIEPEFWLHPFGPLTKNIPLLVLVYLLYVGECETR